MNGRPYAAVVTTLIVVACGGDRARTADSATTSAASVATSAGAAGKPACARTGHWIPCQVLSRLEQAGVAPRAGHPDDLSDLPHLGATPIVYQVGSAGLAVYLFADTSSRARAARSLDTARFIGPARDLSMRGEATAIQSDNLLALLFSRSEQQRERVSDALMAGPPQP